MSTAFFVCAAVTAVSALVSLGFSVAEIAGAAGRARTLAFYTVARSLAFVVIGALPFLSHSVLQLEMVAVGMIVVQACDAGIGLMIHNRMKTFGPAGTAIANLAALVWLLNAP